MAARMKHMSEVSKVGLFNHYHTCDFTLFNDTHFDINNTCTARGYTSFIPGVIIVCVSTRRYEMTVLLLFDKLYCWIGFIVKIELFQIILTFNNILMFLIQNKNKIKSYSRHGAKQCFCTWIGGAGFFYTAMITAISIVHAAFLCEVHGEYAGNMWRSRWNWPAHFNLMRQSYPCDFCSTCCYQKKSNFWLL